jgi:hypothetical protein
LGEGSDAEVSVALRNLPEAEDTDRVFYVDFATPPVSVEVHAVAHEHGDLVGHFRVRLGAGGPRSRRFDSTNVLEKTDSADLTFQVVLVDTDIDPPGPETWEWRYWEMDPTVGSLP